MPDTFLYIHVCHATDSQMPIAWLCRFYASAVLAHSPLCQATCALPWRWRLLLATLGFCFPHKALPLGFLLVTDAIAVGCLSMPFRLIFGRSLSSGEAPFASGRGHFPVVLAPFLFWMQRSSVVGRLNVRLPAVAMMVVNIAAEVRTDSIVRYAVSRRLLFCLVFFESRCRSHLFFRCEFSVMLRCPLSIL